MSPGLLSLCKGSPWKVTKHKPETWALTFVECKWSLVTFTEGEQQATYTALHTKSACYVQHANI